MPSATSGGASRLLSPELRMKAPVAARTGRCQRRKLIAMPYPAGGGRQTPREHGAVASWGEVAAEAPELAAAVEARFAAHKHAVLGTLRRDGGPRLSGTETTFKDGELWLGSMEPARKVDDIRRDP